MSADVDKLKTAASPADLHPDLSEDALASQFTERYRDELLYVNLWGRWLRWDGGRWQPENTLAAYDLARDLARESGQALPHAGKAIRSAKTIAAIVSLARADRVHARVPEDFDRQPFLLNTPAGTVDLRTGETRPHAKADHITKITPVSPGGDCPLWRACLRTWTVESEELEGFLQRLVGYFLTGSVKEEVLPIFHGAGQNGKTKFIEAVRAVMGTDYMTGVAMETLIVTHGEQHPTDVASLRGMRLAVAVETEEGRRLAEAKVKQLTGGDRLRARFMRQDFFEFDPTHKLLIIGNHKPRLTSLDEAIKRRILLVPFEAFIAEEKKDKDLSEKLRAEAPGILRWAIEGCLAWQQRGLDPPASVRAASARYFEEQDAFTEWYEERTVRLIGATETKGKVFTDWKLWAEGHGELVRSSRWLHEQLVRIEGVTEGKLRGERVWIGLGLKATSAVREDM